MLGEEFRDFTLIAFDAKAEALTVRSASTVFRLPLKASRIAPPRTVVNDSVAGLDASKIPEMRVEKVGSRRKPIANASEIALFVEILKNAKVVSLGGGNIPSRPGVTHLVWAPNLWVYQAGTGRIGMVSKESQPLYQVRDEDKELFEQLLAPPNSVRDASN